MFYKGINYLKKYGKEAAIGGIVSHLSVPWLQVLFSSLYNPRLQNVIEHAYGFYVDLPVHTLQKNPPLILVYLLPFFFGTVMGTYIGQLIREDLKREKISKLQGNNY